MRRHLFNNWKQPPKTNPMCLSRQAPLFIKSEIFTFFSFVRSAFVLFGWLVSVLAFMFMARKKKM